jgi:hypothetical protein
MIPGKTPLAALAWLCCSAATPALADSSTSSAASDSVSTSVGSLSNSVGRSSHSSSRDDKVAEGDYRIVELADAGRPGLVRLKLQALADPGADGELLLTLPRQALEQSRLGVGQRVTAHRRPYGLEFARAADGQAFFLALGDAWYRELQTRAVTL